MSKKYTIQNAASDMECIAINLEEVISLLNLYEEHREDELSSVSPDDPVAVTCLVARQHMGLSLLRAIEDKTRYIQDLVQRATANGYEAVRAERAATE